MSKPEGPSAIYPALSFQVSIHFRSETTLTPPLSRSEAREREKNGAA